MIASHAATGAEATQEDSTPANHSYDIVGFELVRGFVEHLVAGSPSADPGYGHSARNAVDWEPLAASVANSRTLEHAIGRAVVIADQLSRGVVDVELGDARTPPPTTDDPFFAFTMDDVVPDFGDGRYLSRVARKVGGIIGNR
jgi:hypothetical protein